MGDDFFICPGGKGANQAVAAARAGAQVTLVAAVGNDDFGRRAVAGYETDNIDTSHIRTITDQPSGVALIMVDPAGANLIASAPARTPH